MQRTGEDKVQRKKRKRGRPPNSVQSPKNNSEIDETEESDNIQEKTDVSDASRLTRFSQDC